MASTSCFLHHPALLGSSPSQRHVQSIKASQVICRAQKQVSVQEDDGANANVSRRLALTVLIGAAAVGAKVSPADAAYGESGNIIHLSTITNIHVNFFLGSLQSVITYH